MIEVNIEAMRERASTLAVAGNKINGFLGRVETIRNQMDLVGESLTGPQKQALLAQLQSFMDTADAAKADLDFAFNSTEPIAST